MIMATGASKCLLLFLFSVLTISSSGTLVGFFYYARKNNAVSSSIETISFLKLNKVSPSQIRVFVADHRVLNCLSNSSVSVDLYLNDTQVESLRNYKPSVVSWLKIHLMTFLPQVNIKSIIVRQKNELPMLLSTLQSINSILSCFHLESQVEVSVSFSLSFLEKLNRKQLGDLQRIFDFIMKIRSFIIVEANVEGELSMGDRFVESVIRSSISAASIIPNSNVSTILAIKSPAVPSASEVAQFSDKIYRSLANSTQIMGNIIGLFAEVSPLQEFEQKELKREEEQMFHNSHRELLNNILPTPTIVTVPSTNPIITTPVTVPSTTPAPLPYTSPANSPVPVTNPVTTPITVPGTQPVTNPVTTYPAPPGAVPVTTPVTTPVAPPATTNAPAVAGQIWCVTKTGTVETAIQAALDYACGIGGADCSLIQQGGSCYNPNTLQNHASYAFNSYYQKNSVQSSCDFGGTAMITSINPSTGTCIYPSSSSSSSTETSSGAAEPVLGSPPTVLNTSNPASGNTTVIGGSPHGVNNSTTSMSTELQAFISCIILVTSIITGKLLLDM